MLAANPPAAEPVRLLAGVGGFEIGALAGLILGAAAHRVPVVLDGFITARPHSWQRVSRRPASTP